jgi:hypothetical protein
MRSAGLLVVVGFVDVCAELTPTAVLMPAIAAALANARRDMLLMVVPPGSGSRCRGRC